MNRRRQAPLVLLAIFSVIFLTVPAEAAGPCSGLPSAAQLKGFLQNAAAGAGIAAELGPTKNVGGLFNGTRMWGAVVNRDGELCAFATSTADPRQVWPGSQQIAKAKAFTANAFSNDILPLSTANLYLLTQPGHSLYGLNQSNPFDPQFLATPEGQGEGKGKVAGGIISFGGGVPIYNAEGRIVGGLGVSGDTACADHEIAKRVRDLAQLNPTGGPLVDDIKYIGVDPPNLLSHSLCLNTVRNGDFVGNEAP